MWKTHRESSKVCFQMQNTSDLKKLFYHLYLIILPHIPQTSLCFLCVSHAQLKSKHHDNQIQNQVLQDSNKENE